MDEEDSSLEGFLSQHKIPLLLSLVCIVLLIGGLISSRIVYKTFFKQPDKQNSYKSDQIKTIKVDVSGAMPILEFIH